MIIMHIPVGVCSNAFAICVERDHHALDHAYYLNYSQNYNFCYVFTDLYLWCLVEMASRVDLKVVLLGKEYGGKTSLVERYIHGKFNSSAPYQSVRDNMT